MVVMKKNKTSLGLDEVFRKAERSPGWRAAYAATDRKVGLAVALAEMRERAQMTQKQLADKVHTTQSVISRIERGGQNVTMDTVGKIAHAIGCELQLRLKPLRARS